MSDKINIITKPEQMCVGRLYMYKKYKFNNTLKKGYCKAITQKDVTLYDGDYWSIDDTIRFEELSTNVNDSGYIAEYNAAIFNRVQKLAEQYDNDVAKLLTGEYVYIREVAKQKWYERYLRRKKK